MTKPVCPKCQRFYKPHRNGTPFMEMMPKENGAPSGTEAPDQWRPYKLWRGDLWRCEGCGNEIIIGALNPVAEHYMNGFAAAVSAADEWSRGDRVLQRPLIRVNDC